MVKNSAAPKDLFFFFLFFWQYPEGGSWVSGEVSCIVCIFGERETE